MSHSSGSQKVLGPYVVIVEHNVVTTIRKVPEGTVVSIPRTKLEVGTELANNYRNRGCIDGQYYFDSNQRAKIFATLCLEFTRALIDKRLGAIKLLQGDSDYSAVESNENS